MIGIKRNFEIGNTYYGDNATDTFICVDRDKDNGKFEHYRNGEFIDVCSYAIWGGGSGEFFMYACNTGCVAIYCKETMHQTVKECENLIQSIQQAKIFEAYLNIDEDDHYLCFYKISRCEYSKSYYIRFCKLLGEKELNYLLERSGLIYLSEDEIKEAKANMIRSMEEELREFKEHLEKFKKAGNM